jgi:hypothetical protein
MQPKDEPEAAFGQTRLLTINRRAESKLLSNMLVALFGPASGLGAVNVGRF